MSRKTWVRLSFGVLLAACALVAAGCGGGGSSSGSTQESEASTSTSSETGGESAAASTVAKAEAVVAPYIGQPSPFPVTEALKEVPKGATIAYMDPGFPYTALVWELMQEPAKMLGIHMERIDTGAAANTVSAAFDSVVAKKPAAVIVGAVSVSLWKKQLEELQTLEIPVVVTGLSGQEAEEVGIESPQSSAQQNQLAAKVMANYIPAEMSPEANVAVYEVPEVPFSTEVAEGLIANLKTACPDCSGRIVQIQASSLGTKAPDEVVSDLQANPETTVAVFAVPEVSLGLPTAVSEAGIEVETLNYGPPPGNLQQIKEGKETAGLAVSTPILAWTNLDQAMREIVGQKLTGPEAEGIDTQEFLRQEDITFDPKQGYAGYADFAERFAKLWGLEG
jgi:ribose transport system substrate-binding protein